MLHTIGDFERLGDHAVNLLKTAEEMHVKQTQFSEQGAREITVLTSAIKEILAITDSAYAANDVAASARVEPLEQVIDDLTAAVKSNHIDRLQDGVCTIEMGFILSDLLNNYERISDHCSNIAVAVIELMHNTFDTHQYLNMVKTSSEEFNEVYEQFSARFAL
jgi:phosphate:Na+ symporter